jgi:hypothetical protein
MFVPLHKRSPSRRVSYATRINDPEPTPYKPRGSNHITQFYPSSPTVSDPYSIRPLLQLDEAGRVNRACEKRNDETHLAAACGAELRARPVTGTGTAGAEEAQHTHTHTHTHTTQHNTTQHSGRLLCEWHLRPPMRREGRIIRVIRTS